MIDMKVGVFVDVISIHLNLKKFYGGKLHYRKYLDKIAEEGEIYRAFAYGAQIENEAENFIKFLRSIRFETYYTEAKKQKVYPNEIFRNMKKVFRLNEDDNVFNYLKTKNPEPATVSSVYQTDINLEMAIDVMRVIHKLDTVVIGSSNPALTPLISFIKERGCKVIVFSCDIPVCLRKEASIWWNINDSYLEDRVEDDKRDDLEDEEEPVKNDYSLSRQ
jgi:uncharacterized LabA/DUF88 family protein